MIIRVRNNIDKQKYIEESIQIDLNQSFSVISEDIRKYFKILNKEINYVILVNGKSENRRLIEKEEINQKLTQLKFNSEDVLLLEEPGFKVQTKYGASIIYGGPIVIFTIFALYVGIFNLTNFQILAYILSLIHYTKRILECIFVHDYGIASISIFSVAAPVIFFYYWFLYAFLVGYYVFVNNAKTIDILSWRYIIFTVLFLFCESQNLRSHLILRDVKIKNKGQRGIPYGGMFTYVSNAHYFWELLSWAMFSILIPVPTAYAFVIFSFMSMYTWAKDKHEQYNKYFINYPKERTAFIPFLI